MTGDEVEAERLAAAERARQLFLAPCTFVIGVAHVDQIPKSTQPEVAFAGRSNVGKSSLVNALTDRKTLAKTSNTPGRTQQLNFFNLGERLMLVDLPGYGYAKAPKSSVDRWTRLVEAYLRGRATLRRGLLLIDSRHGFKDSDRHVMSMLDRSAVSYQIVLTKCDKIKPGPLESLVLSMSADLKRHPAAHPEILTTSAQTKHGIAELRTALSELAAPHSPAGG